jgi:hypothetical protein
MLTGLDAPKLNVGGSCAPEGLDVIAAVKVMEPVNPPDGVTVIIEVLPDVAPGARVTAVPPTVKLGGTGADTVIATDPDEGKKMVELAESGV